MNSVPFITINLPIYSTQCVRCTQVNAFSVATCFFFRLHLLSLIYWKQVLAQKNIRLYFFEKEREKAREKARGKEKEREQITEKESANPFGVCTSRKKIAKSLFVAAVAYAFAL